MKQADNAQPRQAAMPTLAAMTGFNWGLFASSHEHETFWPNDTAG
jgi:hypothetical protein